MNTSMRMIRQNSEPAFAPAARRAGAGKLLAGALTVGLLAVNVALGASNYATPYAFTTIAGTPGSPENVDGTNGAALFGNPAGVALGTNGNLYVVDETENTVRRVAPVGTNWVVTTIAGVAGTSGSADGTNNNATFNTPVGIAADGAGNLFVSDSDNNTIRRLTPSGTNWVVTTIAGTANPNGGSADGTNGAAQFYSPYGITVNTNGIVYVVDSLNTTIRQLTPVGTNWVVTTIAGDASSPFGGNIDGTNLNAQFDSPYAIVADLSGNLFVTDGGASTIRKLTPVGTNWVTTTIAGTINDSGTDDGTNTAALFVSPLGITADANDNLFIADTFANNIRKLSPAGTNWVSTTLAGPSDGSSGSTNTVGAAVRFNNPWGIAVNAAGTVFVADASNDDIREGVPAVLSNPGLQITLVNTNTVLVSWSGSVGTLQTNSDLTTANWGNYGGIVTTSSGTNSVTVSPLAGTLFFRLSQ